MCEHKSACKQDSTQLPASISSLEEPITFLEQKVIINELLLDLLGHASKWVVSSLEFPGEVLKDPLDLTLHLLVLSLSETWVEWVSLNGTTTSYPGAHNESSLRVNIHEAGQVTKVTRWVVVGLLESLMVVINDGVEQVSEQGVCLSIWGIDSYARVGVLTTFRKNTYMSNATTLHDLERKRDRQKIDNARVRIHTPASNGSP